MSEHRFHALVAASGALLRSEARQLVQRKHPGGSPHARQRRAREIRLTLERLGPFYIKVGQILSTRPDMVSDEMAREFGKLHDNVSVQPFQVFDRVLEQELGPQWRDRFATVDTGRPLGAASLAQVHAATLRDGRPVVLKIQRPGIVPVVREDMALLRRATRAFTRFASEFTEKIDVESMMGMLLEAMRSELDFTVEAQHMERARQEIVGFKHLDVPEVLLATPRVMIQSRAPGCSIRDADTGAFSPTERLAIGRDLLAFMYRSFFTIKVFHADPHPGNIFVHPGERASLIDWGMVGRIDRRTSNAILLVLLNLAMNDGQGLARAWIEMGRATRNADIPAFQNDMEALVPVVASASLDELNFGVTLTTVLKSSTRRGIRTNPAIAVLGKSFANLEGSIRYLAPELSITETFRDELRGIMLDLLEDAASEQQIARTALELVTGGSSAVQQLHTVLRDLASGQLNLRVSQSSNSDSRSRRLQFVYAVAAALFIWRKGIRTRALSGCAEEA
jgi:ubiquinone biosynthesis protein